MKTAGRVKTPWFDSPRFRYPPISALVARLEERLPVGVRDDAVLRGARHNYNDDTFICTVVLPDGTRERITVVDPYRSTYFRLEANVCQAVFEVFQRGSGLRPKVDAWMLFGLWSLAGKLGPGRVVDFDKGLGVRGLRLRLTVAELLREMRFVRKRYGRGRDLPDFDGNYWRTAKESLRRLAGVTVEFHYTVLGPKPKRGKRPLRRRIFKGSLISIDVPDKSGSWWDEDAAEPAGSEPVYVTLNLYDGVEDGYFVLLSRYIFELRDHFDEVDTRMFGYLARRHRGRYDPRSKALRHEWSFRLSVDQLSSKGIVAVRPGKRPVAAGRVRSSLEKLLALGVLENLSFDDDVAEVHLSTAFFHENPS